MYRYNNLSKFFEEFFAVLTSLRNERDHTTVMAMVKRNVGVKDALEVEYSSFLTPYALSFVSKQLALRKKVRIIQDSPNECLASTSEGVLKVSMEKCQCMFWNTTHLPCRHIFAIREKRHLPLVISHVVAERWTLNYMKSAYGSKVEALNPDSFQVKIMHRAVKLCMVY